MRSPLRFLLRLGRRVDRGIFWLRTSYWIGSIVGMVIALRMMLGGVSPHPGRGDFPGLPYAAGSFLCCWSLLLIWADRGPRERKGVLLLTLCPLLAGWAAAEMTAVLSSGFSLADRLPSWILLGFLSFLFIFSHLQVRRPHPRWWSQRV